MSLTGAVKVYATKTVRLSSTGYASSKDREGLPTKTVRFTSTDHARGSNRDQATATRARTRPTF